MRCFIALPCLKEIVDRLVEVQNKVKGFGSIKLVEPENIHLTLKFLGEVNEEDVEKIASKLAFLNERKKFEVKVKGLGVFPKLSHVNVIWAGVEEKEQITELYDAVDNRLEKFGFPLDEKFHPHYTIARVKYLNDKEALVKIVANSQNADFGHYTQESVKLMASELSPKDHATQR